MKRIKHALALGVVAFMASGCCCGLEYLIILPAYACAGCAAVLSQDGNNLQAAPGDAPVEVALPIAAIAPVPQQRY